MAITKLNKTVVSGERARATDFNAVTAKIDEIIDGVNGITSGTTTVPKATRATSAGSATQASYANIAAQANTASSATTATNATNDADGNEISTTYAKKATTMAGYGITDGVKSLDVSEVLAASVNDRLIGYSNILDTNIKLYAYINGVFVDVIRGRTSSGNHMILYHYLNASNELQAKIQMFTLKDYVVAIIYEGDQ